MMNRVVILFVLLLPSLSFGINKKECAKIPGKTWSGEVNRCVNSKQTTQFREAHKQCEAVSDKESRDKCLRNLAETAVKKDGFEDATTGGNWASLPVAVLAAVLGGITAISTGFDEILNFSCLHRSLFVATSLGHLAAEGAILLFFENALEEKKKKWKEEIDKKYSEGTSFDIQMAAFDYLYEEQTEIKKVADARAVAYLIVAGGYTATAAVTVVDMVTANPACQTPTSFWRHLSPLGEAYAQAGVPTDHILKRYLDTPGASGGSSEGGSFMSPPIVLVSSLAGAAVAGLLAYHAHQESLKIEKNMEHIKKIKEAFANQAKTHCLQGRNDIKDPQCYCYTDSGRQNPNRSASATCQNTWKEEQQSVFKKATDYTFVSSEHKNNCVFANGKLDPTCRCRSLSQKGTGKNACMSIPTTLPRLGGLSQALSYPTTSKALNKALEGNLNTGKYSQNALNKNVARAGKATQKLLKKLNEKRKKEGLPPISLTDNIKQGFIKKFSDTGRIRKVSNLPRMAFDSRPSIGKSLIQQASKKTNIPSYTGSGRGPVKKKKKKDELNFAFNETGQKEANFDDFAQEYDYGDKDITKNDKIRVWDIITKRYNISGYKRLFE